MKKEDRNIPKVAMKCIRPRIENYLDSGQEVDIEKLVNDEIINIVDDWKREYYSNRLEPGQTYRALLDEVKQMKPDLISATEDLVLKVKVQRLKEEKIRIFRETNAKVVISSALDEAGYTHYRFASQRGGIKVTVVIGTKKIVIPVHYSELQSICEKLIPSIKAIEMLCVDLGMSVKIG